MSLTVPSPAQPAVTRPAATDQLLSQIQPQPATQPETSTPQTTTVAPVIADQSQITPGLQGQPPGGDAQRVAGHPGQVAFVDTPRSTAGGQPIGSPNVATTTYGQGGAVSNNPLESFSFGRCFSALATALAATVVGAPSACFGPLIQPLRAAAELKPSDEQGVPRSQNLRPAQRPADSNQEQPEAHPVTQPVQPVVQPPTQPVRRPEQDEEPG